MMVETDLRQTKQREVAAPAVVLHRAAGENVALFVPADAAGVVRQRLTRFEAWLEGSGGHLYAPDLAAWRDALLAEGIAPTSARADLATVRSRYRELLRGEALRAGLYDHAGATLAGIGAEDSPANRIALESEALTRLHTVLEPEAAPVKEVVHQDRPDASAVP
jgi:hypothetical protein